MPKLACFRLVSVGHPNARMQDITLNFCDHEGEPTDSTLWLRNGGGKSSILNLFFAMLRTNKRDFLGGRADSKQRKLEDYVLTNDRSTVLAEWVLDAQPNEIDYGVDNPHLITGVFYEHIPGKDGLRRLFFCTLVSHEFEETTVQGIPIDTTNADGKKVRRTLASFRQKWNEMRDLHPALQCYCTENQTDWRDKLQSAGLDPGLFGYQLRMNLREGGADELFRFSSPESFIDFLLELTIEPSKADNISENITTFRKQLQQRKHELIPDLELSNGLIERLGPLVELADKREQTIIQAKKLAELCAIIENSIRINTLNTTKHIEGLTQKIANYQTKVSTLDAETQRLRGLAAALRYEASRRKYREIEDLHADIQQQLEDAHKEYLLWQAAIPYYDYVNEQLVADDYREQATSNAGKKAPVLEKLQTIAEQYVAALRYQAKHLRDAQAELKEQVLNEQEDARKAEADAAAKDRSADAFRAEIRSIELNIKKREDQRTKLINLGIIKTDETSSEALERLQSSITQLKKQLQIIDNAKQRAEAFDDELQRKIQKSQTNISNLKAEQQQLQKTIQAAIKERELFENDPVLLQCLEVDSIDLDSLPDDSNAILSRRTREQQELAARLRAQKASLERARIHLQEKGLMPPSAEVENLLEFFGNKINAKSGWAYICENSDDSAENKRKLIQKAPELARGIITSDRDLEKIKNLLKNNPTKLPRIPVTIATPAAFHDFNNLERETHAIVVGPLNDAWFDKNEAQKEFLNIEEQSENLDNEIHKAEDAFNRFSDVSLRFKLFRQRFGRGWFAEQQARITHIKIELEDAQAELEYARDEKQRIHTQRKDDDAKSQKIREDISNQTHVLERLHDFSEELEGNLEHWLNEIARINLSIEQAKKDAKIFKEDANNLRKIANDDFQRLQPIAEEARLLESQITAVRYVRAPLPEPALGDIEALKKQYDRLLQQTEKDIGNEELIRLAEISEKQAKKYRTDAQNKISKIVPKMTLKDVKNALESLDNPNDVALKAQQTEEFWYELGKHERDIESNLTTMRLTMEQHEKSWLGAGKPSLPPDITRNFKPQLADEYYENADKCAKEANFVRVNIRDTEKAVTEQKHVLDSIQKDNDRIDSVKRNAPDKLLEYNNQGNEDWDLIEPYDIAQSIHNLENNISNHKKITEQLDEQRLNIAQNIKKWVEDKRFEGLQNRIIALFKSHDPDKLEKSAIQYREELAIRIREISNTLSDIEKHRNMLSKLILNAAEEGLRLLKLADRASQVPLDIPDIGGSQFLRISTKEPTATTERLQLIQDLVDVLIDENSVPTGVELVQRAVRQLAKPFRVRVLNPDPGSPQRFIEITETARFSGGEQLTCATLLYCTLANVRARTRGMNRQPSGVLLLDNPIGRASRAMFIDMQRQFASSMGIQLIYTTAVNDLEALSILPNVIRLRNERIDKNRGHRILEHDVEIHGMLDTLRVGKIEEKSDDKKLTELDAALNNNEKEIN